VRNQYAYDMPKEVIDTNSRGHFKHAVFFVLLDSSCI